jgi:hypothetical protein
MLQKREWKKKSYMVFGQKKKLAHNDPKNSLPAVNHLPPLSKVKWSVPKERTIRTVKGEGVFFSCLQFFFRLSIV